MSATLLTRARNSPRSSRFLLVLLVCVAVAMPEVADAMAGQASRAQGPTSLVNGGLAGRHHPGRHGHGHDAKHGGGHRKKPKPSPTVAATPTTDATPSPAPSLPVQVPVPVPIPTLPLPAVPAPSTSAVTTPTTDPAVPATPRDWTYSRDVFGAGSVYHADLSEAPVAPNSAAVVSNLTSQVINNWGGVADFHWDRFNVSMATASASTPRTRVIWDDCFQFGWLPSQLYDAGDASVFTNVPIPDDASPAAGTDHELSVWNPASDQVWEFWQAHHEADGWHACWGGRIDHASTSVGTFDHGTGVSATGLSDTGTAISIKDIESGSINHVMSLNVIEAANWQTYSWPANRSDGNAPLGASDAIQEGQRFRLDPSIDVDALPLTPVARIIATAAQKYGFIVIDTGGAVALNTEDGGAIQAASGTNPWDALLNGVPSYQVLANFPWSRLQALPVDYGKPA